MSEHRTVHELGWGEFILIIVAIIVFSAAIDGIAKAIIASAGCGS